MKKFFAFILVNVSLFLVSMKDTVCLTLLFGSNFITETLLKWSSWQRRMRIQKKLGEIYNTKARLTAIQYTGKDPYAELEKMQHKKFKK